MKVIANDFLLVPKPRAGWERTILGELVDVQRNRGEQSAAPPAIINTHFGQALFVSSLQDRVE